jgi:hypothetical protein
MTMKRETGIEPVRKTLKQLAAAVDHFDSLLQSEDFERGWTEPGGIAFTGRAYGAI